MDPGAPTGFLLRGLLGGLHDRLARFFWLARIFGGQLVS